jgi:hypothetical protein
VNNGGSAGRNGSSAGSAGYAYLTEYSLATYATQTFTITNIGNGAELDISSITSQNLIANISAPSTSAIGYDFDTFTGNTATFTVTPYTLPFSGVYSDVIVINSNASNAPALSIPYTLDVAQISGQQVFVTPGTYQFTIPPNVTTMNAFIVGGGGGGSGAGSNIKGGGGSAGEYIQTLSNSVNPGDILTVIVGAGGAGGTYTQAGSFGANSSVGIMGGGTVLSVGGSGGNIQFGGAGGSSAATVTLDNTTYGPYGAGGAGGSQLAGQNGQDGAVVLWWDSSQSAFLGLF